MTRSDDDVIERQHDALGTARGAGGIQNDGQIGTMPLRYMLVKIVWTLSIEASALLLKRSQGMQAGGTIVPQTTRIVVNNGFQLGAALVHGQELVDLFL